MENIANAFSSFTDAPISMATLTSLKPLTNPVRDHLKNVYMMVMAAIFSASLGIMAFVKFGFGGGWTILGSIGFSIWLMNTPYDSFNPKQEKRALLLLGMAFFHGSQLGPLVGYVIEVDPRILLTAFLATASIFVCFSGAAILAKRRSYLYLGGLLSSAMTTLLILSLGRLIIGGAFWFNIELYLGLLVFCGYVLYDSQMIIEKAFAGDRDYVWGSVELFLDFAAIFTRILVILAKNKQSSQEKKENSKRR